MRSTALLDLQVEAYRDINEAAVRLLDGPDSPTVAVGLYAATFHLAAHSPEYRAALQEADRRYPDGAAVAAAMKLLGVPSARIATTDLVWPVLAQAAQRNLRVALIGGRPGVADQAAKVAISRYPADITTRVHGHQETSLLLAAMRAAPADIYFIGVGAPRELTLALQAREMLSGPVRIFTCGGLFDFMSGRVKRAPRYVQHMGLEWLFRVAMEPRRLAGRYARANPWFIGHAGKEIIKRRRAKPGH